jgi:hypothetical protein
MANQELEKYIQTAREQKVSDIQIKSQLMKSGWDEKDVTEALAPKSSVMMPSPPPPVPRFSMWVAFQYIIMFIALYVSATALAGLLNYGVDKLLPDNIYSSFYSSKYLINGYLAALIVSFPIFAVLFVVLNKQAVEKPMVKQFRVRKQLIYFTMVMTFIIMIWHLIATVYSFLNGQTTTSSLGHFGVTLLVAGTIFLDLLIQVKEDRNLS